MKVVGDPGIEPGVRLREGVTVPCHTLRPVAHFCFFNLIGCLQVTGKEVNDKIF